MCVSFLPAEFSGTVVGAFIAKDGTRYMAYQNTVVDKPRKPKLDWRHGPVGNQNARAVAANANWSFEDAVLPGASAVEGTGNAMILPVPDDFRTIKIIDTSSAPNFLADIDTALKDDDAPFAMSFGSLSRGAEPEVRIVDFDIYRIVIAANAKAIAAALKGAVSDDMRPELDPDILDAYTRWYPDWAITVWCFNTKEAKRGKPALISYAPTKQDPRYLFVPTLDGHTGGIPNLKEDVHLDSTVFVATPDMVNGSRVFYSDDMEESLRAVLPNQVIGRQYKKNRPVEQTVNGVATHKRTARNGDLIVKVDDVVQGTWNALRALPLGADGTGFDRVCLI